METENAYRQQIPGTPKFMQGICIKMNASFTRSPTTKRYFRYSSVCVGALFPRQRNNSVCLNRAFLGMLIRVWTLPYGNGGGPDEGSDFAFLNLAIFFTVRNRGWPRFSMFWVAELTEFGSGFQLQLLQNNDCNSQNLHRTFLTQETQQIGMSIVTCVSNSTFFTRLHLVFLHTFSKTWPLV